MNNHEEKIFTKTPLNDKININGIYTIHYFKYGQNFRFENESHDFYELVYIDSGTAIVVADGKKHNLKQGEAFIHAPNVSHTIYTNKEFSNSAIVTFDCNSPIIHDLSGKIIKFSEFDKILLNKIINEGKISFSDKPNDLYLTKMNKRANAPFAGEQIIKNCTELLLISLIRSQTTLDIDNDITPISLSSDKIVESILKILHEKLDSSLNINLDEISFSLGFSKSHIKTQFKKKTGFSILQYFISLKIEKAKKLLSQQKYTVCEISDMLGFSSVYYFSRQFKTHTNMSPTKYVNSINADNIL